MPHAPRCLLEQGVSFFGFAILWLSMHSSPGNQTAALLGDVGWSAWSYSNGGNAFKMQSTCTHVCCLCCECLCVCVCEHTLLYGSRVGQRSLALSCEFCFELFRTGSHKSSLTDTCSGGCIPTLGMHLLISIRLCSNLGCCLEAATHLVLCQVQLSGRRDL